MKKILPGLHLSVPFYCPYYAFAFGANLFRSKYHIAPVKHTEEYVPQTIPTIKGRAKSRILVTPRIYSTATMIKVVRDVKMLLDIV